MGASLESQIEYVKDNIKLRKKLGKDTHFEESLLKEWRQYLPGGSKYHLWVGYSDRPQRP